MGRYTVGSVGKRDVRLEGVGSGGVGKGAQGKGRH